MFSRLDMLCICNDIYDLYVCPQNCHVKIIMIYGLARDLLVNLVNSNIMPIISNEVDSSPIQPNFASTFLLQITAYNKYN